ncbi:SCP-like protein [Ancylostoma duodenale]|uniref:SCP-like protein n=1 Tax=Ancylostoma duodenale TaxID=51022 RepID=A0A0C2FP45_9BILA|nr:SCP-like protein [Ancylostoma duodenale]
MTKSFEEYDCDLERLASNYARGCQFKHSPPEYRNAGESLYTVPIDNLDKNKVGEWATRTWFGELKEFGVGTNILTQDIWNLRGKLIGHYTQMVWGETDRIGCGIHHCRGVQTLVVCHYRKGGNMFGQKIYEIGEPCTKCPYGYICTKDKLCARR